MSTFTPPVGVNFRSEADVPASVLAASLLRTVRFLQEAEPYARLYRYEDWWEHDGLHSFRGAWDEDGYELFGRFDITLPRELAVEFRKSVLPGMEVGLLEMDAEEYYRTIVL